MEPALDSWDEGGWSSDWGEVDAEWAAEGEELYSVTEQEPFSSLLGPGHAADIYWEDQGQSNCQMLWMTWREDAQAATFSSCVGCSSGTRIPSLNVAPARTSATSS